MSKKSEDFDIRLAPGTLGERFFVVSEGEAHNIVFSSENRLDCEQYVKEQVEAANTEAESVKG